MDRHVIDPVARPRSVEPRRVLRLTAALGALALCASTLARPPDGMHTLSPHAVSDHLSPAQDRALVAEVDANLAQLRARGVELPVAKAQVEGLVWPLGPDPGIGRDWHGISNFVDLNAGFPNQLRDYTCATRTYDNGNGYNHAGIDYFIFPFPWHLMDTGAVDVRAVAPGTLVAKGDGNDDRSCSFDAPDTPNYAIVQHADGTMARYLHMKRGSVTTLPVGSPVSAGQILGKVGSSGISTGPHLHLELRASNTPGAAVIEPHAGECNAVASGWPAQRPYRETRVNRLSTHNAAPVSATCPDPQEQPNFSNAFAPGDAIVFLSAWRDIGRGMVTHYRVLQPDGSAFDEWEFDIAQWGDTPPFYNAAYGYWSSHLPDDAPEGEWTFAATLDGRTTRHAFTVGEEGPALVDPRGLIGLWYEPATSGQGFEVHWLENDLLVVYFYGHRDDGSNIFLLGTRQGRFDYGEALAVPMAATTGGRFNEFDADAIERSDWGTLTLTFDSCERATAELQGDDGAKTLALERLGRTPGLDCD